LGRGETGVKVVGASVVVGLDGCVGGNRGCLAILRGSELFLKQKERLFGLEGVRCVRDCLCSAVWFERSEWVDRLAIFTDCPASAPEIWWFDGGTGRLQGESVFLRKKISL
jgi:hypothetical protein